jgi:hypothetical protein
METARRIDRRAVPWTAWASSRSRALQTDCRSLEVRLQPARSAIDSSMILCIGGQDGPICGARSTDRHLLAQRCLRASEVSRHRSRRTQPVPDGQAGDARAATRRHGARRLPEFDDAQRMELCGDPLFKQRERAVHAIGASGGDQRCRRGVNGLRDSRVRTQGASRHFQAAGQFPDPPILIGGTLGDPASQFCPRLGHRVSKMPQQRARVESLGRREAECDPERAARIVRRRGTQAEKHRAPREHSGLGAQRVDAEQLLRTVRTRPRSQRH